VTGKDLADVASVPSRRLIGPAVVLDFSEQVARDPDFLIEVDHIKAWETEHGALPADGWMLVHTGWDARAGSQESALNADESGPHTPGLSAECARWVAQETPVLGMGVETVGTDAGAAFGFDPPFPCHSYLMGSDKYGLTQLQNLAMLPPAGSVLVAGPLRIETGSGSPARVLALVER
jgi:kynurenine formamidase